jgi:hypothetical protein
MYSTCHAKAAERHCTFSVYLFLRVRCLLERPAERRELSRAEVAVLSGSAV